MPSPRTQGRPSYLTYLVFLSSQVVTHGALFNRRPSHADHHEDRPRHYTDHNTIYMTKVLKTGARDAGRAFHPERSKESTRPPSLTHVRPLGRRHVTVSLLNLGPDTRGFHLYERGGLERGLSLRHRESPTSGTPRLGTPETRDLVLRRSLKGQTVRSCSPSSSVPAWQLL